jgi:hypothetical protein
MEKTNCSFAKLRDGSWGIRGPVDQVVTGSVVMVVKKNGQVVPCLVDHVLWSNTEVALATIGQVARKAA